MEEDITNHAEFPENGLFNLGDMPGSKYKVCGEPMEQSTDVAESLIRPHFSIRGPSTPSGWGQSWPWASESDQPGPSNALLRKKPKYDSCLKRTIPYVSLATDSSGRNVLIQS